ncbi:hypothetical protein BV898_04722 [Hypsibius exemplaris]|uniref:Uncharacterized protein n=1 Tax=Hypsibius exemplaris TaxID=2072580 RepID=A0A1W0X1A6_HYPEX|nr:hypothetical protein BV898_04722 [Hypsibius exemplaris]
MISATPSLSAIFAHVTTESCRASLLFQINSAARVQRSTFHHHPSSIGWLSSTSFPPSVPPPNLLKILTFGFKNNRREKPGFFYCYTRQKSKWRLHEPKIETTAYDRKNNFYRNNGAPIDS